MLIFRLRKGQRTLSSGRSVCTDVKWLIEKVRREYFTYFTGFCFRFCSVQQDDIGAHINLGRTYNHLKMFKEAEEAYLEVSSNDKLRRVAVGRWFLRAYKFRNFL